MNGNTQSYRITSASIRTFATELSENSLKITFGRDVLEREPTAEEMMSEPAEFPKTDFYTYGMNWFCVSHFQQSTDHVILGRVKFFDAAKMAWRNEAFEFDDHSPVVTVEFLFDRKERTFLGASSAPTVTFRQDYVGELCAMGLGSPYEVGF